MQEHSQAGEVTRLLQDWQRGYAGADERLWSIVYFDLKNLARSALRDSGRDARHDATSLVNKAYLRLVGADVDWNDRRHFFLIAARAMRFILADEARHQLARKRGDGQVVSLEAEAPALSDHGIGNPAEVLAIHQLLDRLAEVRPRHEQLVELRYFAGLTVPETARILQITPRTVVRDWQAVRIWLLDKLRL
ncbi:sigma-70 family RNA polymerase sigma factor [Wenzhouxiangella sp. AB-CW3]|uniref:ECF-type sigma factor n=1 Tax=Wenzhouxiangella sp. AB-CW3 TaxID=2771012 RepID=UPI00168B6934|nr:ECF-type sigma factor [Wenzhouxiangella sp. AB-CW3]QOC22368.1 sigma-70 family RNA polymerase sigma factor [Wenzhouxiangella sp. AB-CW3]